MSKIEVDQIVPKTGTNLTVGESGDTVSVPAGATFDASSGTFTLPDNAVTTAKISANAVTNAKLQNSSITINGSAVNLGGSVTILTGIEWQATVVTGATHTATAGQGIWIDTTSNGCTLTLPASPSVGDELVFSDFARQWGNNGVTLSLNGSKYQGQTSPNPLYDTEGETVHIVYSGATQGWIPINDGAVANEVPQAYSGVQYLVVAGGGGGGHGYTGGYYAGGGGAGGYRNSYASETSGRNSSTESTVSFTPGEVYTVTVGGQGAARGASNGLNGSNGTNSSIVGTGVNIVSTGGGFGMGGSQSGGNVAGDGGCGGGGADGTEYSSATGGNGTAGQGFDGGNVPGNDNGGASGAGAGSAGLNYTGSNMNGGAGLASSITGSSVTRAVGGGGSRSSPSANSANTGDGGDGSTNNLVTPTAGATGVVIIRIPTANYSGVTSGSPTVTTEGSDKVLVFNSSGSVTG